MKLGKERYIVPVLLGLLVVAYTVLVFLSDGTVGGADDITHYRYSRYAFQNPYFFLHHWGKPFFTALTSPFAQFGYNGIRIFNVLAGAAAAFFSYRTARKLGLDYPVLAIFLVISAPLYTMLMLSGMTEILFSLLLILSIFLFYEKRYIWAAALLSFLPFVRTEGAIILPLFMVALAWNKQWKALPFLFFGFVFYSIVGSFHFKDILWVIHEMPYKGNAKGIYGSGKFLHYVESTRYIFGFPLAVLALTGLVAWAADPLLKKEKINKEWIMEMLVIYFPAMLYFAAHSYVWWKGKGNSVGMIRVIDAVVPVVAVLGVRGWSGLMGKIPLGKWWKTGITILLSIFLVSVPYRVYDIPVPVVGTQALIKEASDWLKSSEYFDHKVYYYDPFWCFFLNLNPYDEKRVHEFVYRRDEPEYNIMDGEIVLWDAHFSPNEGQLPLENLMDSPGFRLIHLVRPEKPFKVLGGYEYEIYIFQRITLDDWVDNYRIREQLIEQQSATAQ
jgi:hypothetical protein